MEQITKGKNNLQLRRDSDLSIKFSGLITKKILSNELIKSFALPKKFMEQSSQNPQVE